MSAASIEREVAMNSTPSLTDFLRNMIPITDLNKGKSAKIIGEVKKTGYKVILKNNRPEAVLITPKQLEEYEKIKAEYEDMALAMEAYKRLENFDASKAISHTDILNEFGISQEELDSIDVEIN